MSPSPQTSLLSTHNLNRPNEHCSIYTMSGCVDRILFCILSKFMNFQVGKMYGTIVCSMDIYKQSVVCHPEAQLTSTTHFSKYIQGTYMHTLPYMYNLLRYICKLWGCHNSSISAILFSRITNSLRFYGFYPLMVAHVTWPRVVHIQMCITLSHIWLRSLCLRYWNT